MIVEQVAQPEDKAGFGLSRVKYPYIDYMYDNLCQF